MKKGEIILTLFILVFSIYLISSIEISPLTFSVNPNISYQYKITINNNEIWPEGNITIVNITVPTGLTYIEDSNSTTSSFETFRNDSNILAWENSSSSGYLINGTGSEEFWFNAIALNFGNYNITVLIANETESAELNISVTIEDITDPSISFKTPTPSHNSNLNQTFIPVKVEASDNVAIDIITIYIYGSTGLLSSSTNSTSPFSINFTGLSDGEYTINATVNDSSGNENLTTRKIILNTTLSSGCTENWDCTIWTGCSNNLQIRSCIDLNACNSSQLTKNESQSCGITCTPKWDCSDWAPKDCQEDETQTRTCTDSNNCNLSKPLENKPCNGEEISISSFWVTAISITLIMLVIIGIFFYIKNKGEAEIGPPQRTKGNYPPSTPPANRPRKFIGVPRFPRIRPMINPSRMIRRPAPRRTSPQRMRKRF